MSNSMNKTLIDNIRNEIENYWRLNNNLKFNHSNPKIRLHEPTFGPDEVMAMVEGMLSTQVTMGKKVLQFENDIYELYLKLKDYPYIKLLNLPLNHPVSFF